MGLGIQIMVNNTVNEKLTGQVSSVEVHEIMDQPTQYKINFMIDICDKDIAKSLHDVTDPHAILGILVAVKDELVCLVNGPVTKQKVNLQHGGAGSSLQVEGTDDTHLMDKKTTSNKPSTDSDSTIVRTIFSHHSLTSDIEDTGDSTHHEDNHSLSQIDSDFELVKQLAGRNGYHFWITYDEKGKPTGHFRSRNLAQTPQNKLIVNLENNNIDQLNIEWDIDRPTKIHVKQVNLNNKTIIEEDVTLENEEILGEVSLKDLAKDKDKAIQLTFHVDDVGAMIKRGLAALKEAHWFITARCQTSLHKLCDDIVRPHTIVTVDGAGSRHSGKYYVTGVNHTIDAANHKMDVTLARNGWGKEGSADENLLAKIF